MKSAQTLRLLNERGTEVPRSRPRVSDDNPYIESLFKMMKYAGFMGKRKYKSLEHCKKVLAAFAAKYNHKWAHSSVNNVTPATVTFGWTSPCAASASKCSKPRGPRTRNGGSAGKSSNLCPPAASDCPRTDR